MILLHAIEGERAWEAADRAAGAPPLKRDSRAHFDAIKNAPASTWTRISSRAFWEALECLPPIYIPGGFAVSEAVTARDNGETVYLCIIGDENNARARYATLREARGQP